MQNIPSIRDALRTENNYPLIITCDNAYRYNERFDYIIWDDSNECLISFTTNNITELSMKCPLMVCVTDYEHIQKIELAFTVDKLSDIVDAVSTFATVTDDQKTAILNGQLKTTTKFFGDKTNKEIAAIAERLSSS